MLSCVLNCEAQNCDLDIIKICMPQFTSDFFFKSFCRKEIAKHYSGEEHWEIFERRNGTRVPRTLIGRLKHFISVEAILIKYIMSDQSSTIA